MAGTLSTCGATTNRACIRIEVPTATTARCRDARKGANELLPRVAKAPSAMRVSDGMRKSNSEDSMHYGLLLSDGDINNRGEDDEGFNTLVCRFHGNKEEHHLSD